MPARLARLALSLALLLSALPARAAEVRPGPDRLVVAALADPQTLDPQAAVAISDLRIVANLFEGLVRFKPGTLDIEPGLAESWSVSPDGLRYRFALRRGVTFQDGTPFDAEAVKFTFERMLDPGHPQHGTGAFPLAFLFADVESVAAVDAQTVEFRLSAPSAPFLASLATPTGAIVSPAAVQKAGTAFGHTPVGTGPFALAAWTADGVELVPNAAYRGGAPGLSRLVFKAMPDAVARRAALQAGTVDVMMEAPYPSVAELKARRDFTVSEAVAPHLFFLILNTREGPFADKRVRQAANYAIDKERLVREVLGGGAEVAGDPVPSAFGWADAPDVTPYPYDPEHARALIKAAGAEGKRLRFLVAQDGVGMLAPVAIAEAVRRDLEAVGLKVEIQTYEWRTFLSNVNPGLGGRADMAEMAWTTHDPDTLPFLALRSDATPGAGGFNAGSYANPEVDRRLAEAHATPDRGARARLYREIQALVREDAPWVFLASWKENLVAGPRVSGVRLEPTFLVDFQGATKR